MDKLILKMDKACQELDARYMSVQTKAKQIEMHNLALEILQGFNRDDDIILAQINQHEESIRKLKSEICVANLEFVEDLMLLDDYDAIDIMRMRYVDYLPWEKIAEKKKRSARWAQTIRNRALRQIVQSK